MSACTITISNGPVFTRTFIRDPYRKHLVNAVSNCFDSVLIHASDYSHDLLSRRTNIVMTAQTGTNILSCAYNARNEVTGVTIDTNAYTYSYDNIGNSLYTSLNTVTNAYTVNNLNQYKGITNLLDFTGYRLLHDSDGNTTRIDDHFLYYDDENRLSSFMFGNASMTGTVRSVYAYDHLARRVSKTQQERRAYDPGGMMPPTYWWHTNDVTTFVYDGWNLIHERVAHTNGTVDEIEYAWGLDLSGTRQGAGGVGGLLFEKRNGHIFIPCYDANGNITSYVDTNGTVRAYRQFDAFGNTVSKGGDMVDTLHFWFSTKYLDHDTGLYYYGYRYYSPMLQRWINRDPIGEEGGHNLFLACYNNLINLIDNLGLSAAFYAKGKGETLFHLAAEEQYVERYYYSVGDALKNKNNSDYWGAIRKGELPVKVFTLAQLLEESGQVEIYAHGVADGGEIREVGGDVKSGVNSSRLKNELTIGGGGHKLTSLWSLTCRLGLRGGAQEFANILKIPVRAKNDDSLLKVLPYVDFTWSMKLSFWKKQHKNDIIDTFTELGNNARAGLLSYEGFRNEWKKKTDQYRKQGCIKGAYWHVRETTGNFVDYSPK